MRGQTKNLVIILLGLMLLYMVMVAPKYNYAEYSTYVANKLGVNSNTVRSVEMTQEAALHSDTSRENGAENTIDRRANKVITEYNPDVRKRLQVLIDKKAAPDDPEMLRLIREMMDPPSDHIIKTVRKIVHTPQSKEAKTLLNNKKNGFFIEVGGLDGERSSNTIALEHQDKWTGLLIEMDPYFYTQLLGKNRKAWSINACLSPYNYPVEMDYKESSGGGGELHMDGENVKKSAVMHKVPCFPFESMLLALNRTHIDFFSLDVEGFELEILKTVDFKKFDITVLTVEYAHGRSGKLAYKEFMEEKGYSVHKDIHYHQHDIALFVDDYVFVKN